jgi:putative spermidine/putrescine transport system permease protein
MAVRLRGYGLLSPALAVMAVFFLGAMVVLLVFSLQPFSGSQMLPGTTLDNYRHFLGDGYYRGVLATTMKLGGLATGLALLIGYPTSYALHKVRRPAWRSVCYFVLFSPLLTSVVVRSYGWSLLLGDHGLINATLRGLHLTSGPVHLLYELSGVTVALVHILLPFMVFPILGVLGQVDESLREAAADLGASRLQTFWRVTVPLTVQGALVGCQLVFALAISAFATPSLLGGGRVQVLATLIYGDVGELNWPLAAVESYALLVLALLAIGLFNWLLGRTRTGAAATVEAPA